MMIFSFIFFPKNDGHPPKIGRLKAMANRWRRRRRRTIVPTMTTKTATMAVLAFLLAEALADHQQQTARAIRRTDSGGFRAQRICYQCQMPMQCQSGFCYGDFCVKSMVADKYVSKGCENRTISAKNAAFYTSANPSKASHGHGPLYARSAIAEGGGGAQIPSHAIGIAPGCVKMRVFGVQNTVCYCDNSDYCNGGVGVAPPAKALTIVAAAAMVSRMLLLFTVAPSAL